MNMWIVFVFFAALSWGIYGPVIHMGQAGLGSPWRALLFVGLAYCLVGVLVPMAVIAIRAEPGAFTFKGSSTALAAGVLGACGALFVILAFQAGARPIYVMPLVFAGAPMVNALVSMVLHKPAQPPAWPFWIGMGLAAAGAWMVLAFKPS
jgi:hypothetical protein